MSLQATVWALNDAPVFSPSEALVLVALAENAHEDGTAAWPSHATLARRAKCSISTVQRRLSDLEERGLIRRGDQELLSHYAPDRRPVVWDLVMIKTTGQPDRPEPDGPRSKRPVNLTDRSTVTDKPSLIPSPSEKSLSTSRRRVGGGRAKTKFQPQQPDDALYAPDDEPPALGSDLARKSAPGPVSRAPRSRRADVLADRLADGLEADPDVRTKQNRKAIATNLSADRKVGADPLVQERMVEHFLARRSQYTFNASIPPWETFIAQRNRIAEDCMKIMKHEAEHGPEAVARAEAERAAWESENAEMLARSAARMPKPFTRPEDRP